MREQVERTTAPQRIGVTILVVFATLALVSQRSDCTVSWRDGFASTRELALRIALALTRRLAPLVMSRSLLLTGVASSWSRVALQVTRCWGICFTTSAA